MAKKRKRNKTMSPIKGLRSDLVGFGGMAMTAGVTGAAAGMTLAHAGPAAIPAAPIMAGFGTVAGFAGPVALASGGKRALDAVKGLSVEPKKKKSKKWRY